MTHIDNVDCVCAPGDPCDLHAATSHQSHRDAPLTITEEHELTAFLDNLLSDQDGVQDDDPDLSVICRDCGDLVGGYPAGSRVLWTVCEDCAYKIPAPKRPAASLLGRLWAWVCGQ